MHQSTLLLQAAADAGNAGIIQIVFFVGILLVFYFFLIRPQQQKAKEEKKFREGLAKGDKILTIGGIYGKVVSMDDTTAIIEVEDKVKIKFDKTSLRAVPTASTK